MRGEDVGGDEGDVHLTLRVPFRDELGCVSHLRELALGDQVVVDAIHSNVVHLRECHQRRRKRLERGTDLLIHGFRHVLA